MTLRRSAHPTIVSRLAAGVTGVLILALQFTIPPRTDASHIGSATTSIPVILRLDPEPPLYADDQLTVAAETDSQAALEYQFLWDGVIIQPWSEAASCRVVLPDAVGTHRLTVQVRSQDGAVQEAVQALYVYRKPVDPPNHDPSTQ